MRVSIVIPTRNRCDTLLECLDALERQTCAASTFDVIVVDDGSSDGTEQRLAAPAGRWGSRLKYVRQANRGVAAARNLGARLTGGELLLFMSDDIIAVPDYVQHHVSGHEEHPEPEVAVLGKIAWSPKLPVTPLLRWLDESGMQFDYVSLDTGRKKPSAMQFYTSNLSLKRVFFDRYGGFDEAFPFGYEDIELGLRLEQHGMRLIYRPEALGYHDHPTSFETRYGRARTIGKGAYTMQRKYPGLIGQPYLLKRIVMRVARVAGPVIGPLVMASRLDKLKIAWHIVEYERLFWQAYEQQAASDHLARTLQR